SEMVEDIYNNVNLTAEQKKMLLEYKYLVPYDPTATDYDPLEMCDEALFPSGKFDFTRPSGIQYYSFATILKPYCISHITEPEEELTAAEATIETLQTQVADLITRVTALEAQ